jgi:hypothetical protein
MIKSFTGYNFSLEPKLRKDLKSERDVPSLSVKEFLRFDEEDTLDLTLPLTTKFPDTFELSTATYLLGPKTKFSFAENFTEVENLLSSTIYVEFAVFIFEKTANEELLEEERLVLALILPEAIFLKLNVCTQLIQS